MSHERQDNPVQRRLIADAMRGTIDDAIMRRWRAGPDTYAIAQETGLHEATVCRAIARRPVAGAPRQYRKEA